MHSPTLRQSCSKHSCWQLCAGAVAIQLPAAQGQCALMECAGHCPVLSNRHHHNLLTDLASIAAGGPQCHSGRPVLRHLHSTRHKPGQACGEGISSRCLCSNCQNHCSHITVLFTSDDWHDHRFIALSASGNRCTEKILADAGLSCSQVGRPRPNFVALCWPEGNIAWDDDSGLAVCSKGAINPGEGRKSFPSGEDTLLLIFSYSEHPVMMSRLFMQQMGCLFHISQRAHRALQSIRMISACHSGAVL